MRPPTGPIAATPRRAARLCALALTGAMACGRPTAAPPEPRPAATGDASVRDAGPRDAAPSRDRSGDHSVDHNLARDLTRLVARSVELYRALAAALAASGVDCAAATAQVTALADTYRDVAVANDRVLRDGRGDELRRALAAHGGELDALARAIVQAPTMAACIEDRAFGPAIDALFAPPPTPPAAPP